MDDDAPLGAMPGSRLRTGSEPIRRFEVLTGVDRRRSFAVEDKLALVAQMAGCGNLCELARRWQELTRFLDDGRVELDGNTVERAIRPLALNRKNALFAGSDDGGDHWAVIASLIETAKLNGEDPQAWLADTLSRLAAGHPAAALEALMPWLHARDVA